MKGVMQSCQEHGFIYFHPGADMATAPVWTDLIPMYNDIIWPVGETRPICPICSEELIISHVEIEERQPSDLPRMRSEVQQGSSDDELQTVWPARRDRVDGPENGATVEAGTGQKLGYAQEAAKVGDEVPVWLGTGKAPPEARTHDFNRAVKAAASLGALLNQVYNREVIDESMLPALAAEYVQTWIIDG